MDIKKLKFHALVGDVRLGGERCLLMKPQTMMNLSGDAVAEAANFYKIPPEREWSIPYRTGLWHG